MKYHSCAVAACRDIAASDRISDTTSVLWASSMMLLRKFLSKLCSCRVIPRLQFDVNKLSRSNGGIFARKNHDLMPRSTISVLRRFIYFCITQYQDIHMSQSTATASTHNSRIASEFGSMPVSTWTPRHSSANFCCGTVACLNTANMALQGGSGVPRRATSRS